MANDATISRFDRASEQYRTDSIKYRKISADRVSQLAEPSSKDVVLDIGCGTGTQLIELAGTIQAGIGIDISAGMIQQANGQLQQAGCDNLKFHMGEFLNLEREISLKRLKINKIISNYALHHLPLADKKKAVEKMVSVVGARLEMVVIGDLMFFDDPAGYAHQYGEIGYGPGPDQPSYASELAGLFDKSAFAVTMEKLHPLVGVLKAVRKAL